MKQLKDLRSDLRALNYKIRTNRNSLGRFARIVNSEGQPLPSIHTSDSIKAWQDAIDVGKQYEGQLVDGKEKVLLMM